MYGIVVDSRYISLIKEWSEEAECRAACEATGNALGEPGCCWHLPVQRAEDSCQWITNGHHDVAGAPTIRSAADCTGMPDTTSILATSVVSTQGQEGPERGGTAESGPPHRNLRELMHDSDRRPQHCPAQQPGFCPDGVVHVSQRRKVAELAARIGVEPPPDLDRMEPVDVDVWLVQALVGTASTDGEQPPLKLDDELQG